VTRAHVIALHWRRDSSHRRQGKLELLQHLNRDDYDRHGPTFPPPDFSTFGVSLRVPAGLVTDCNRRPVSQAYVLVHAVPAGWLTIIDSEAVPQCNCT
jgi:hypothetical protein